MKLAQLKLSNFQTSSKLVEFITHLESVTEIVTFVCQSSKESGNVLLLEYDHNDHDKVYYYSNIDYLKNNPIIRLGVDCTGSPLLTTKEQESLEMKSFVM